MKLINRIICFFKKRHTVDYLKRNGGKFHQFYDRYGGGVQCTCAKCGYHAIIRKNIAS